MKLIFILYLLLAIVVAVLTCLFMRIAKKPGPPIR